MEARAELRQVRISPRKVGVVLDLIRNKPCDMAMAILKHTPKAACEPLEKLLKSAIANAENNHDLDVDQLIVAEAFVGKSITMKRFHARGRGRASRIEKPFAHLTIIVREVEAKGDARLYRISVYFAVER